MTEVLQIISSQMENLELNYEFGRMTESPPTYPYWVGSYSASEPMTEDGLESITIMLNGFARDKFIELEAQKDIIKDHFKHGVSVITDSGAAVVVFYVGMHDIPSDESDLKRCQINLLIKLWKE
jgi:hypothetical protein